MMSKFPKNSCNIVAVTVAMSYVCSIFILIPPTAVLAQDNNNDQSPNVSYTANNVPSEFLPVVELFSSDNNASLLVTSTDNDTAKRNDRDVRSEDSAADNVVKVQTTTIIPNISSTSSSPSPSSAADRKCTQKDTAGLNKCLQQVLQDLKPRLAKGIPEISLPPMEPLKLGNIGFEQGSGTVKIVSYFSNVEVSGLSNFSQSHFWVDVPKRTMDFDIIFPQLSMAGVYELSGNLFFIPIGGTGNFYLNLGGIRAKGASKLSVFRNSTTAQVIVKKTDVNLEIETIKVHLTNLFNGDRLLGTFINNFLNENSQEVFAEVKPQIGAQVGEMLSLLANQALSALSTSHLDEVPFSPSSDEEEDDDDQDV